MKYGANEAALDDDPSQPRFIRITDISEDGVLRKGTFKSLPETVARDYMLEDEDLLFARSGATVGKAFIYQRSWGPACFAGYLIRFRCERVKLLPKFLFYFTQGSDYWSQVGESTIQATIQNVSAERYADVLLPLPSIPRQIAIVNFLDWETSQLDALVAAKERVLGLLAEKRRAFITHAVTRGLDTDAPVRDSHISWLGVIPAHWGIWKVGHFAMVGNGSTPNRDTAEYWADGTIPWLNSSVVNQDEVREADQFITRTALQDCHLPLVKPGSVLIGITGQGKTRGQAVVLSFEATINQHMAFITPNVDVADAWFLRWALFAAYDFLRSISDDAGGTKGALTCEEVSAFPLALPVVNEQRAIVARIAAETAKLDAMSRATERTIALLKERRAALIAAAVTGAIDVREAVA